MVSQLECKTYKYSETVATTGATCGAETTYPSGAPEFSTNV